MMGSNNNKVKNIASHLSVAILGGLGGFYLALSPFSNEALNPQKGMIQYDNLLKTDNIISAKMEHGIPSLLTQPETLLLTDKEGSFVAEFNQNIDGITDGVNLLNQLISSGNMSEIAEIKQQLMNIAKKDDAALDALIESFKNNMMNSEISEELIQVLGSIQDPRVESMALDLVSMQDRNTQLNGLSLLGQLDMPSEATLDVVFTTIQQYNNDPEMLESAMHAMPKVMISSEKNAEILMELSELSSHKNASVRSASLFLISQQAKNGEQLSPIISALKSADADDKISAVLAIEQSHVVDANIKNILLERMGDENELPEVRAIAANSLKRFNLDELELSSIHEFRENQQWNIAH